MNLGNVLSCFDGMSCGQIALNRAGVGYDSYFASEIDKFAIQVTQKNYPGTVQIGDISKVKIKDLPKIDLLIGGSPCQGFSFAGKGLNFEDPRSKLFFEFVRLKNELRPKYFLLENVKMKKEHEKVISEALGVEPIMIDSKLVSAQSRKRLYWTNIIGIRQPDDKGLLLKDVLEGKVDQEYDITERFESKKLGTLAYTKARLNLRRLDEKSKCLTVGGQSISNSGATNVILADGSIHKLTPLECEHLQTVPEGYTDGVSDTQRYKMLGNGWTIDVIAHIFKSMIENDDIF